MQQKERIFLGNRNQSTVFSLHISISLSRMATVISAISGNHSVCSIAKVWKHSQIQDAQAMRLRDTEGRALRADRSHVALTGGHAMRAFDFAPLYRSTVGFDRMFSMLDQFAGVEDSVSNYPPYNIERASENAYRISVAVAGFTDADLSIETKENRLTIRGEKQTSDKDKTGEVLYQGIAARTFERSFQLADYVKVKGASLENGLLHVDLVREIPEAMKSRSIPIG